MATLTNQQRKDFKSSDFAIPAKRKYPIPDAAHARDALARVAQDGSPQEQKQVRDAVRKRFPEIDNEDGDSQRKIMRANLNKK